MRRAEWSSEDATWTVSAERTAADGTTEPVTITCNYLFMCSGYYSYREPYDAEIPGLDQFAGRVVHPQFWPDDLDDAGKRVVVIGSGATAMTLVPAMAATAGHVTMLQRSPTYVVSRPDEDVDRQRAAPGAARTSSPTRSPGARTSPCSSSSTTSARRSRRSGRPSSSS